jgi:predicted N-formylglutamate amidohydrolase
MNGESLLGNDVLVHDIVRMLRAEGLTNISYNYFAASTNQTITKFASARGVPAIQLEISSTWLTPSQGDLAAHRFAQLLQAIVRYVEAQSTMRDVRAPTGSRQP